MTAPIVWGVHKWGSYQRNYPCGLRCVVPLALQKKHPVVAQLFVLMRNESQHPPGLGFGVQLGLRVHPFFSEMGGLNMDPKMP